MDRPRLFAEFPAGLAAVSLRLHGGAHCRPPISRMGNKAGFSQTILGVLGLHSGQGAGAYWWAEADPDVAALLRIYPDPDALREVARIIRGWSGEEPRALWERLRAQRRARAAEAAATIGATADALAEFVMINESNRLIPVGGPHLDNTARGGGTFGAGGFATPARTVADRTDRLAEVAEFAFLHQGSFQHKGPDAGIGNPQGQPRTGSFDAKRPTLEVILSAIKHTSVTGWPPVRVSPRIPAAAEVSAALGTPGDLEGCVIYMDPPYAGTTGYTADLPRAEVVAHARDFADLGATVAISEAEAIPDLVRSGWHSVEITGGRVGQKRTFSKQQQEIITMNKLPQYTVPTQSSLFG